MIRLIDVALIILLGFIAISRLKTEYVDLSAAEGDAAHSAERLHPLTVHVHQNYYLVDDARNRLRCTTLQKLETVLRERKNSLKAQRISLVVTIEPHKFSIMQRLVDAIDICERNAIEKLLNYESVN